MPAVLTPKRRTKKTPAATVPAAKKPRGEKAAISRPNLQRMIGLAPRSRDKTDVAGMRAAQGLSLDEFARLIGYSTRAVAGWEAGKALARPARRRLAEIGRLLKALSELMPQALVGEWLRGPNEAFNGQTPMHLIERGESDRLWEMIHQIDANVAN